MSENIFASYQAAEKIVPSMYTAEGYSRPEICWEDTREA
jgi:hypothetical protein